MKKIIVTLMIAIITLSSLSLQSEAKLKDSPKSGYTIYFKDRSPYYNKVNGKKQGVIKAAFAVPGETVDYINYGIAVKYINEKWAKVKFYSSVKNIKANKYNKVAYVKVKDIQAEINNSVHFIVKKKKASLRAKPLKNSKVVKTIPLGTQIQIHWSKKYSDTQIANWHLVEYVYKGKLYIGYINEKDIR